MTRRDSVAGEPSCSFCGKDAHQVRKLVAGPNVRICDECIGVCVDIVSDHTPTVDALSAEMPDAPWGARSPAVRCALCRMPCLGEDVLLVEGRGVICRPCVADVEALSAEDKWARISGEP